MADNEQTTTTTTPTPPPARVETPRQEREEVVRPMVNMPVSTLTREKRAAEERGAKRAQKELLNLLGYESPTQMADELRSLREFRADQIRLAKEREDASTARAAKEREEQAKKDKDEEEARVAAALLARRRKAKQTPPTDEEDEDAPPTEVRATAEEKKFLKQLEEERKARTERERELGEERVARSAAEERAAEIEAERERDSAMRQIWSIARDAGVKEDEEELVMNLVEKFVSGLDSDEELEAYTDPQRWVEGFFEPLKQKRPYLFAARAATTGATKPSDSATPPGPADVAAAMSSDKRDAMKMNDIDARQLEQEILASAKQRNVREYRDRVS